ncbi:GNAT family N-acetyltransferase [Desulforamulus aeronauticus]|uniref:Predicted acetyltransferase, GNAT superfamily n=1 Tax=Desulforamulus aeronauticus DSM 10349 TaxID=1121421 RepID=A0A1M6WJ97_9FIRM|nr:GNAT family N-acetyltransferase [Desulforamulus aeronauticus]SHK93830.1 Predicted acetyltransferase, GNAT superfamily [Desulforamulus aeronauticus DSM 10349]
MPEELLIRPLNTVDDMKALQEIEQIVWDSDIPIPVHQTITVAKNGGVLLGAFQEGQMIGMLYSFPGYLQQEAYLCSHAMAVLKEYRHGGIGEKLKYAQAEAARDRGYRLISWTYDPLLTPNGYLNVGKLGVICSTYLENCYGDLNDQMNKGLPTDRLQVEWWINEPKRPLPQGKENSLIHWQLNERGLPVPLQMKSVDGDEQCLTLAVPAQFSEMKAQDMGLAIEWRRYTSQLFKTYFADGWAVAGFRLQRGQAAHEYLLVPRAALALPRAPWQKGA